MRELFRQMRSLVGRANLRASCEQQPGDVAGFARGLAAVTRNAERGHHAFVDSEGVYLGFTQLLWRGDSIVIHRIWTLKPGKGDGSRIMRILCDLADRHGVVLSLKV